MLLVIRLELLSLDFGILDRADAFYEGTETEWNAKRGGFGIDDNVIMD